MTYTDRTAAKSGVLHKHGESEMDAKVDALAARVAALEAAQPAPTPDPTPTPTPDPTPTPTPTLAMTDFATKVGAATAGQELDFASGTCRNTAMIPLRASGAIITGVPGASIVAPVGRPNGLTVYGSNDRLAGLTFRGETFTAHDSSGAGLLNVNGRPANNAAGKVTGATIEDVLIQMNASADKSEQGLYLSGRVDQLLVRRTKIDCGNGAGYGLHFYHDDGLVSDEWTFEDMEFSNASASAAIILWVTSFGGKVGKVTFRRVLWHASVAGLIARLATGGDVYFTGCKAPRQPTNEGSTFHDDGTNDWAWAG